MANIISYLIKIAGIVQGVGFRPFVFNLANLFHLSGWVANQGGILVIDIEGDTNDIKSFVKKLINEPPKLAVIKDIRIRKVELTSYENFKIHSSQIDNLENKFIPYDVGTCPDCLNDTLDKTNKRYHYAFTNCTSCGPRYSIIKRLPYDRFNTTMINFKMCPTCQAEYENPTNRRFHAQPNCCPKCGPTLKLINNNGEEIDCDDIIEKVCELLKRGKIIAIKGLGGFHLACDAFNEKSIELLRLRKKRPHKPFSIMIKDMDLIKSLCDLNQYEEDVLLSFKSPIVILKRKESYFLPKNIAPNLNTIGIMLPYTPLHHLLFESDIKALIMTSANVSSSPIQYDNNLAINNLCNIADYFLIHNRDIYTPIEDSVVKVTNSSEMVIRRGRGYSPYSVDLNINKEILALGSEEKANFSISQNGYGHLSHYLGDLKDYDTYTNYNMVIEHFKEVMGVNPVIIAHDLQMEPIYKGVKYVQVQHHHAHMVSCMVEHGLYNDVIGIIYDGTGLGTDGTIWGGEILIGNRKQFKRIGHFKNVLLQGGSSAVRNIWKIAYSYLYSMKIDPNKWIYDVSEEEENIIKQALEHKINCFQTSSVGRLFDCVSVLLNLCNYTSYQGQGAIELESIINPMIKENYDFKYIETEGIYEVDYENIIKDIIKDIDLGIPKSDISTKFHNTIGEITIQLIKEISFKNHINDIVLSGGVFQNDYLLTYILNETKNSNLKVYFNKQIPINDGGISIGQLAIADALERVDLYVHSDSRTNSIN